MARIIGYIRVSTIDQDAALQRDALADLRPKPVEIVEDVASGAKADRPGLKRAIAMLEEGDTLAVWKLDRLGRSLPHLIETVKEIEARGANLACATQGIDTRSPGGRLVFHVFGAMAEFERDLIRDRVTAGMTAAKRAGKHVGRPNRMNAARTEQAWAMLDNDKSWSEVCRVLEVHRSTLARALKRWPKVPG